MKNIPRKNQGFTNLNGTYFDKVKEVAFKKGELIGNLGTFVAETKREKSIWQEEENYSDGVYIYQSLNDPHIAYRIYKCFADYGYNGENDDILIQKLLERQDAIKLSKFPIGVVTLNGKIIGQEIPYYVNSITLFEFFKKYDGFNVINIYKEILNILKELFDNGILYLDNQSKNFMVDPLTEKIKVEIIDFMYNLMVFDNFSESNIETMFNNFKSMVNGLNNVKNLYSELGEFKGVNNFDDAYYQINEMAKKLQR